MTQQPLLTLAIPTFNRSTYLAELLETVAPQLIAESRVELLISDNCSTDNTAAVIERFRSLGLRLRYLRNEANLGVDANFLQCFNQAVGKYFWLIGDDDVLTSTALAHVLALLGRGEEAAGEQDVDFDLVYLSTFEFSGKYDQQTVSIPRDPFGRFAEVITDGGYFLERINGLITLISSVIVNKSVLSANGYLPIQDLGKTNISQLAWVLPAVKRKSRILYVWERVVGYRVSNSRGWAPCQVFGVNLPRVASHYYRTEPGLVKSLVNGILRYWLPAAIIGVRLGKHPSLVHENCIEVLTTHFRYNWRYWLFVYPVGAFPLWLAQPVYACLRVVNKFTRVARVLSHHYLARPEYVRSHIH